MDFKNILAILFSCSTISFTVCSVILETNSEMLRSVDERIVGGVDAINHAHPHQVSLQNNATLSHFCGGSIIAPQWIVTAAHCVNGRVPAGVVILAGTNFRSDPGLGNNGTGVRIGSAEFFISDKFNSGTMYGDIALIKLQSSLTYGATIQPIPLPKADHKDPTPVELTGWGYTNRTTLTLPERLQFIELETLDVVECHSYMTNWGVGDCHVCTKGVEGRGACNGDSGGPLTENGTLIGTVSFGYPCALGLPDVYCRVSCFTDWILETIDSN